MKKRVFALLLCLAMVLGMIPTVTFAEQTPATYTKVQSMEDIVPNATYIIVGKHENAGETSYYVMGKTVTETETAGYRAAVSPADSGIVMGAGEATLSLSDSSVAEKIRLRPSSDGGRDDRYYLKVGSDFLKAFYSTWYETNEPTNTALKATTIQAGEFWWQLRPGQNGFWQMHSRWYGNAGFAFKSLQFLGPEEGKQFQSCDAAATNEDIDTIADANTNILLYREDPELAADTVSTGTYVKVNSTDEIIPNARYILVGKHVDSLSGDVSYHLMGRSNNTNNGYREASPSYWSHIDVDLDESTLRLPYTSYALHFRLRPYGDTPNRYSFKVDDNGTEKYLFAFGNQGSTSANNAVNTCLPVATSSRGEYWWQVSMGQNGFWQMHSQWTYYGSPEFKTLRFLGPYPSSVKQFQSYQATSADGTVNGIAEIDTNVLLYREVCAHKELAHEAAVKATCTNPGIVENWFCKGCEKWFADAACTEEITLAETFIPADPHNYSDGVCDDCGGKMQTQTFYPMTSGTHDGRQYIAVAKYGEKYYVMGQHTIAGKRYAFEVTPNADGSISTDTIEAEFLTYSEESYPYRFTLDGGYLGLTDGRIVVSTQERYNNATIGKFVPQGARWSGNVYDQPKGFSDNTYLAFAPGETQDSQHYFVAQATDADNVMFYETACTHENKIIVPAAKATCIDQGSLGYMECQDCWNYYALDDYTTPLDLKSSGQTSGGIQRQRTIAATGHNFVNGVCTNCMMDAPVYSPIDSFEDIAANPYGTGYLFVFEDGGKTYAAKAGTQNPWEFDSDYDGTVDALEADTNSNGIPDALEFDEDGNGIYDFREDYDGDGQPDEYLVDRILWEKMDQWAMENEDALAAEPNFVEVTPERDGTITLTDEGALELYMDYAYDEEYRENSPEDETALQSMRVWIPNYWVNAQYMGMYSDHFHLNGRTFGDREGGGDMAGWFIDFDDSGNVLAYSQYMIEENGQLRLMTETDAQGNVVSKRLIQAPDSYMDEPAEGITRTFTPVKLYAAPVKSSHTHTWDAGKVTKEATCGERGIKTYTCTGCGGTKTEPIAATGEHTYGDWEPNPVESENHIKTCTVCGDTQYGSHIFDSGIWIQEPTLEQEGIRKQTCIDCGKTKEVRRDKLDPGEEFISAEVFVFVPFDSTAAVDKDTVLDVDPIEDDDLEELNQRTEDRIREELGKNAEIAEAYDIELLLDGAKIQPGGRVRVTVKKPANAARFKKLQVVHVDDDGDVTSHETTDNGDGTLSFETDHFSTYAIVGVLKNVTDMDNDGDVDTNDAVYLLLNVMFGDEDYPVEDFITKDMNSDGKVDTNDAVYLLLHVMFGAEDYPI